MSLEWQGASLVVAGRLDASTAPVLRREIERARFDVDLVFAAVTFLSSAGLGALLAGQKHLVAQHCHLRLVDVDGVEVDAIPHGNVLLVKNDDRPGVVGHIGTILGARSINIARMMVGRKPGSGRLGELQRRVLL